MVDLDILIWLALAALVAGWVDAVAGGGGLLQVPALLLGLPGPGVQALGTNKVASVFGTAAATGTYLRKVRPDMRAALPMTVLAFIGSLIGVTAKIVNLGTNVAAIIVFGLGGYIWWQVALVMAVFNVVGAVIGARMALRRGSGFVRVVFLVIVAVLIVRLIVGW